MTFLPLIMGGETRKRGENDGWGGLVDGKEERERVAGDYRK